MSPTHWLFVQNNLLQAAPLSPSYPPLPARRAVRLLLSRNFASLKESPGLFPTVVAGLRMPPSTCTLLYLLVLVLSPRIRGGALNVTIDDQFGDPTTGQSIKYNPPEAWQTGQDCTSCTAKPTPASGAYMGTWTDATFNPNGTATNGVPGQIIQASVPFIGTAVYVQVILTGSTSSPDGNTDYTFSIDGVTSGVFQQTPNGDTSYKFNQTVFAISGLSNSLHNLTIESGHAGQKSLVLLDSVIYTKDDDNDSTSTSSSPIPSGSAVIDSSGSSTSSNVGVIVGPVVGAIIVLGAVIALFLFLRRRRHRRGHRVRVSLDSPPMGAVFPAHFESNAGPGPNSEQFAPASNVYESETRSEPYIANNAATSYVGSGNGSVYSASARRTAAATGPHSEVSYGSSVLFGSSEVGASSQHLMVQPRHSMSGYAVSGEVDESAVGATAPLASPPAYSEVDASGPSNVSTLPNPHGKR